MMNLQLNANGDIFTRDYGLARIAGRDQIAQGIGTRLKLLLGEWFLDVSQGVPWFDSILIKNPNRTVVQGIIRRAILQTEGVVELVKFDIGEISGERKIVINFTVLTSDGGSIESSAEVQT